MVSIKRDVRFYRNLYPDISHDRPMCRAECPSERPCPFVGCRYNLYLDVNEVTGNIIFNFPDIEPDEMTESCTLDISDMGGLTLEEIGHLMNLTRERIRQIELRLYEKLKEKERLTDYHEERAA